ncbi:hypothetical protein IMZ48_36865, partial [Candidatus Bathyarchaeota archaeon]|nr:hypothetical protein [Candidatus Bathyarchaeota archaeon]
MSETSTPQPEGVPAQAQAQRNGVNGNGVNQRQKAQKAPAAPKKELKVLMLHGMFLPPPPLSHPSSLTLSSHLSSPSLSSSTVLP